MHRGAFWIAGTALLGYGVRASLYIISRNLPPHRITDDVCLIQGVGCAISVLRNGKGALASNPLKSDRSVTVRGAPELRTAFIAQRH